MEQVFNFKKGKEPYKEEKQSKYGGSYSSIERIINDVNEPKINKSSSGTSGRSGSGDTKKKKIKVKIRKIVNIEEVITDDTYKTHEDYLDYLESVYHADNGYVIKPDFIWFTILSEMTQYINSEKELFRKYYTVQTQEEEEKYGKTVINVPGIHKNGYIELPVDLLTKMVLEKVPSNFTEDMIVPKFSTLTENSEIAFKASFLESVSNYYSFGAYACGYSKIKILGNVEDYILMISTLNRIIDIIPEFKNYFTVCIEAISEIIKEFNNKYFWHDICWTWTGYGSHSVDGWFTKFFRKYNGNPIQKSQFNKHIAKVPYIHTDTGDQYIMYVGIFTSTWEDGCYMYQNSQK